MKIEQNKSLEAIVGIGLIFELCAFYSLLCKYSPTEKPASWAITISALIALPMFLAYVHDCRKQDAVPEYDGTGRTEMEINLQEVITYR